MPRRTPALLAGSVLASAMTLTGCTGALPGSVSTAPVLSIATGLWPLAQMAQMLGGAKVVVEDVVPAGADPLTYVPGPSARSMLRSSGLVLDVGGGFQPALESAAAPAPARLDLGARLGTRDPYVWLDPTTMARAVTAIVAAMAAADPGARALFERNSAGVEAQLQSLGIDYSSTFTACPGTAIVTPDGAFSVMAADYGLQDRVVGADPSPAALERLVSSLPDNSRAAGLSEPWVDDSGVQAASAAGHFPLHPVDTLAAAPSGTPATAGGYFAQMEQVLGAISDALGCPAQEQ